MVVNHITVVNCTVVVNHSMVESHTVVVMTTEWLSAKLTRSNGARVANRSNDVRAVVGFGWRLGGLRDRTTFEQFNSIEWRTSGVAQDLKQSDRSFSRLQGGR